MRTIEMTKDFLVAEDGINVEKWEEGTDHECEDRLAQDLIDNEVAKELSATEARKRERARAKEEAAASKETKDEGDSKENKGE